MCEKNTQNANQRFSLGAAITIKEKIITNTEMSKHLAETTIIKEMSMNSKEILILILKILRRTSKPH